MNLDPILLNQITPPIAIGVVTIIIGNLSNYLINRFYKKAEKALLALAEKTGDDRYKAKIAADKTKFVFMKRIFVGIIYVVGILFMVGSVPSLRTLLYSLLAGAGVVAVIIGFATQKTFANIISGMMIAVSQPFRIGDRVKLKDEYGIIEDITLRHTVLKTWDNRRVVIPNAIMNDEIIVNYTMKDERILATLEMNISYDSDIDLARKIMKEEIMNHPDFIVNTEDGEVIDKSDAVKVRLVNIGDSSITLRAYYWVNSQPKAFKSACTLRESIKKRFEAEGVEIPFPYRTIVYKKELKKPRKFNDDTREARGKREGKKE